MVRGRWWLDNGQVFLAKDVISMRDGHVEFPRLDKEAPAVVLTPGSTRILNREKTGAKWSAA